MIAQFKVHRPNRMGATIDINDMQDIELVQSIVDSIRKELELKKKENEK
ncbi:MAG: hypothetical protein WC356_01850 [Candidatus Micrarchaeia archaeon]